MPNTDLFLAKAYDEDRERGLDRRLEIKRVREDGRTEAGSDGSRTVVARVRRSVRTLAAFGRVVRQRPRTPRLDDGATPVKAGGAGRP